MRLNLQRAGDREGWLANRRVGASSVAAILGLSPYQTPYGVWATLTGRYKQPSTDAMQRGHRFEPAVIALYGGHVEVPPPFSTYLGEEDWQSATPDGFVLGDWWIEGLLECKTDAYTKYPPSGEVAGLRDDYVVQCRWQMFVLDAPWVDLAVLLPYYDFRVYRIERDMEQEQLLVEYVRRFYHEHVVADVAPEVDGSDACTALLAQVQRASVRHASREEMRLAFEHEEVRKLADEKYKRKKLLANQLVSSAGEHLSLEISGAYGDAKVNIQKGAGGTVHPRVYGTLNKEAIYAEEEVVPEVVVEEPLAATG
jgi:putative phage-type endonuclease